MKLSVYTGNLENRFGLEKAAEMIKSAGFDALDFTLDDWATPETLPKSRQYQMTEDEIVSYYTEVKKLLDRLSLTVGQTHAMFGTYETNVSPAYWEVVKKSILATHILGCSYVVIHPFRTPGRMYDEEFDETFTLNLCFYRKLQPYLQKYGVKLAIEPMWSQNAAGKIIPTVCSRPEEILKYIEIMGNESFCACLDFGHIALTGKDTGDTVDGAIRKLGKAMEVVHIHETDGIHDNHTAPYNCGGFDWNPVLAAMKETGYHGTFNFEVCGNYFNPYPDNMVPEALRHLAAIGRDMIAKIEQNDI